MKEELFYSSNLRKTEEPYLLYSVEVKHRGSDYVAPIHTRKDHQFYLCLSPKIRMCYDSAWSVLEPGDFSVIPPGLSRGYQGTGGEHRYLLIHFSHDGNDFEPLYGKVNPLFQLGKAFVESLNQELQSPGHNSSSLVNALATQVLIGVVRASKDQRKDSLDERVEVLEQYMKTHFHLPLGREELGAVVSLSPSHVGHLYRKLTGKTLVERLTEIRLEEARKLLETTTLPITYISLEVGFNSYSHFTQLFKRSTGLSPSDCRR